MLFQNLNFSVCVSYHCLFGFLSSYPWVQALTWHAILVGELLFSKFSYFLFFLMCIRMCLMRSRTFFMMVGGYMRFQEIKWQAASSWPPCARCDDFANKILKRLRSVRDGFTWAPSLRCPIWTHFLNLMWPINCRSIIWFFLIEHSLNCDSSSLFVILAFCF